MSTMEITKTKEDHYHVEVRDLLIEEDVNDIQLRGMIQGRTTSKTWQEVQAVLDSQPVGYVMNIEYQ